MPAQEFHSHSSRRAGRRAILRGVCAATLIAVSLVCAPRLPAVSDVVPLGQIEGASYGVSMSGTLACIGAGPNLFVLDCTVAATPERVGTLALPGVVTAVTMSGTTAYVGTGSYLRIVDVSVPSHPVLRGSLLVGGDVAGIATYGTTMVCVAVQGVGLKVVDVSSPASPSLVGTVATPGLCSGVAIAGAYAVVGDGTAGVRVISLADPSAPTLRGAYNTPGFATSVAMSGSLAFVADGAGGLQIVNCSNPDALTLTGSYAGADGASGIILRSGLAYIASGSTMTIVDVSAPATPTLRGQCAVPYCAVGIALQGNVAYLACRENELTTVDVSVPATPTMLENRGSVGWASAVVVGGTAAYVAAGYGGLKILDVSDPLIPAPLGRLDVGGCAFNVSKAGPMVYLSTSDGLRIANVADPEHPILSGTYLPGSEVYDAAVVYSPAAVYGCVIAYGIGMTVANLTNPAAPVTQGTWAGSGSLYGVALSGSRAYVANGDAGLRIINIADPSTPALLGTCNTPGTAYDVAVSGTLAFVADGSHGLQVVNVTNPAAPVIIGQYDSPGYAESLAVSPESDMVFLADGGSGVVVLDVSNPASPAVWGASGTLAGYTSGVAISNTGEFAVAADQTGGIYTLGNRAVRVDVDDTFPTGGLQPPGSAAGWSSFGYTGTMGWPDYDVTKHAYQAYVTADATHYRNPGVISNIEEWMPFDHVRSDRFVRAKYYVYAGGQAHPADGNEIPNMRLRLQNRFAVNSMLEVFSHTNDASAAQRAMDQELRPSTDPARPSIYRVDMAPVAVPYLLSNGGTEGIQRAFEAYAIYPQDNGLLYMNESVLGLYMDYCLPETGEPQKLYAPSGSGAGDLRVVNAAELDLANLIPGAAPGDFSQRDPAPRPGNPAHPRRGDVRHHPRRGQCAHRPHRSRDARLLPRIEQSRHGARQRGGKCTRSAGTSSPRRTPTGSRSCACGPAPSSSPTARSWRSAARGAPAARRSTPTTPSPSRRCPASERKTPTATPPTRRAAGTRCSCARR